MARTDPTPTNTSIDQTDQTTADSADGRAAGRLGEHLERTLAAASPSPDIGDVGTSTYVDPAPDDFGTLTVTATVARSDVPVVVQREVTYDADAETVSDAERGYVDGVEVYTVEHDAPEFCRRFRVASEPFDSPVPVREYVDTFAFAEPTWAVGGRFLDRLAQQQSNDGADSSA